MTRSKKTEEKSNGLSKTWKTIITIGAVATIVSAFALWNRNEGKKEGALDNYKEAQKEVTFDDSSQKNDVVNLLDIEIHPFRLGEAQKEIGESQVEIKASIVVVDSLITTALEQKIKDAKYKKTQDSIENDRAIDLQINRDKKYELQEEMNDNLILVKNELRNINLRLDTIN